MKDFFVVYEGLYTYLFTCLCNFIEKTHNKTNLYRIGSTLLKTDYKNVACRYTSTNPKE